MPSSESLYIHGGKLAVARLAFPDAPEPWIDLSTGINPMCYPIPTLSAASWTRLPEENALLALERIAASAYGARSVASIVVAPGTQALIELLPRLFPAKRVGILGFTYTEHAACWRQAGAVVETVEQLADLVAYDVAILVNPNNPDGRYVPVPDVLTLAEAMAERGGRLIVDEAFVDVLFEGASLVPYLPDTGAIVLRSFGKTYGLAGVRLGFALAGLADAALIRDAIGLWAVSGMALELGSKALGDREWLKQTRESLIGNAVRLDGLLRKAGLDGVGGTPLYRLVSSDDAALWFKRFSEAGILVRAFRDKATWLRVGLPGDADEWTLLEQRLKTL